MRATSAAGAAIVLLAGAIAAGAQTPRGEELPPEPAPPAHQNAPAEKIAPTLDRSGGKILPAPSAQAPGGTTGQGAAGGASANLTLEQSKTIRGAIEEQKVAPLSDAKFTLTVGSNIPRRTELHPLPPRVLEVYPAWRGYHFVMVERNIVVVDPVTFLIVAVIEA